MVLLRDNAAKFPKSTTTENTDRGVPGPDHCKIDVNACHHHMDGKRSETEAMGDEHTKTYTLVLRSYHGTESPEGSKVPWGADGKACSPCAEENVKWP